MLMRSTTLMNQVLDPRWLGLSSCHLHVSLRLMLNVCRNICRPADHNTTLFLMFLATASRCGRHTESNSVSDIIWEWEVGAGWGTVCGGPAKVGVLHQFIHSHISWELIKLSHQNIKNRSESKCANTRKYICNCIADILKVCARENWKLSVNTRIWYLKLARNVQHSSSEKMCFNVLWIIEHTQRLHSSKKITILIKRRI